MQHDNKCHTMTTSPLSYLMGKDENKLRVSQEPIQQCRNAALLSNYYQQNAAKAPKVCAHD